MPMQRALLEEDGATFRAIISPLPDGRFRATCYARLLAGDSLLEEMPDHLVCETKTEAREWVHLEAAKRNFCSIHWDDEYSKRPG
jgi:hypothetical protein